jgi:predicted RNA-binding Zn ribbon-like protein
MPFTHDTECALVSAARLVNTVDLDPAGAEVAEQDRLSTPEQLARFLDDNEFTGRRDGDHAELEAVRALRPRLRRLWTAGVDEMVLGVNALLAEARALPQLVRHDGWDYHLHATSGDDPVAVRLAVEAAMALVDVIRAQETDRLRTCAAQDCQDVVVDLSRNRSRRYCEQGCGNRVAVAAYRARRAGA